MYRIVVAQSIATFLASVSCLAIDRVAATSALSAGVVCLVPGIYVLVSSIRPLAPGESGLGRALKSEAGKLAITVSLFALIFVFVKPLDAVIFFGTFVMLQLGYAIVPWWEAKKQTSSQAYPDG